MAKQTPTTRAKLVIEGDSNEVMEIVTLAVAGGLLKSFEVDEATEKVEVATLDTIFGKKQRRFQIGDYVRVRMGSTKNGLTRGHQGTVVDVLKSGGRSKIRVRMDDGYEVAAGGSYFELISAR